MAKLCPDADDTADLYEQTVQTLEQAGFDQYEISNFARRGYESRHNRKYWRCEEYLGIGPDVYKRQDQATTVASVTLIAITAILTGLQLFDKIAKVAGAGTIVPITGFANAMVSPAREDVYKRQHQSRSHSQWADNVHPNTIAAPFIGRYSA